MVDGSTSASAGRRVDVATLRAVVPTLMTRVGMPADQAAIVSDVLIDTSLRGIESHGVEKLVMYLDAFERRTLNVVPDIRTEDVGGPAATIDGDLGLGFVPSVLAARLAVEKAGRLGVGAVAVRSSGHFGAGGYYVRKIAEAGMVGFISTNARPVMPTPGGTSALVGNNPFAFAAPRTGGPPFVFDMACSVSAFGKVRRAAAAGERVPADWGYDATGTPTDDPDAVLAGGFLAPVGGYKGFNLAMMMELLSAALCGAAMGPRAGSVGEPDVDGCGHFVLALAPSAFGGDEMGSAVEAWLQWMRAAEPLLRIPGEAGADLLEQRMRDGIDVSSDIAALLADAAPDDGAAAAPDQDHRP